MTERTEENNLSKGTAKPDEVSDYPSTEEPPTSLEAIVTDTTTATHNEVQATNTAAATISKDKAKIDILLKATANAPIMKQKKWSVCQDQTIGRISEFVKKYLKLEHNERLFLYINQTFAPAPDQTVKNLYDCYGAEGKLIVHYCKSQAWG